MTAHNDTVGSVILECHHAINSSHPLGVNCAEPYDELDETCKFWADTCLQTVTGLSRRTSGVELLVGGPDGAGSGPSTNWTPAAFEPANATIFAKTMIDVAQRFSAVGVNVDSEPDQGGGPTYLPGPFAAYLQVLKPILNGAGIRLTADVAQWCPMTSDYALLAPTVDRMLNMEQYNANSMDGWLNGDEYGGYYVQFLSDAPVDKCAPGLGIWKASCGTNSSGAPVPCWTTLEESGGAGVVAHDRGQRPRDGASASCGSTVPTNPRTGGGRSSTSSRAVRSPRALAGRGVSQAAPAVGRGGRGRSALPLRGGGVRDL